MLPDFSRFSAGSDDYLNAFSADLTVISLRLWKILWYICHRGLGFVSVSRKEGGGGNCLKQELIGPGLLVTDHSPENFPR